MSFSLASNFFLNARGVTFADGGGITWTFNPNTNTIEGSTSGGSAWPIASGFGTPTGAAVVANFSGTAATNAQMQATIAEILTVLKSAGIIAA